MLRASGTFITRFFFSLEHAAQHVAEVPFEIFHPTLIRDHTEWQGPVPYLNYGPLIQLALAQLQAQLQRVASGDSADSAASARDPVWSNPAEIERDGAPGSKSSSRSSPSREAFSCTSSRCFVFTKLWLAR